MTEDLSKLDHEMRVGSQAIRLVMFIMFGILGFRIFYGMHGLWTYIIMIIQIGLAYLCGYGLGWHDRANER